MIVVFCAQIYRNRGWVYERKDLKHAETVLTVEHRGGHFPFTKVTSPLGSRGVIRWGSSPHARTKLQAAFSFWKMQLLAFLKQRL